MKGYVLTRTTTIERSWRPRGFDRTHVATTTVRDALECEIGLGLPSCRPQDQTVLVSLTDARRTRSLDLGGPQAAALGERLFDAGCLYTLGTPAFDEMRGTVVLDDDVLCIRFGQEEGLPPILLIATDTAAFPPVRFYPEEAVGIGIILIYIAYEIAQATPAAAEAA